MWIRIVIITQSIRREIQTQRRVNVNCGYYVQNAMTIQIAQQHRCSPSLFFIFTGNVIETQLLYPPTIPMPVQTMFTSVMYIFYGKMEKWILELWLFWDVFEGPLAELWAQAVRNLESSWHWGSSGDGCRRQYLTACCFDFGLCRVEKDFLLQYLRKSVF